MLLSALLEEYEALLEYLGIAMALRATIKMILWVIKLSL